MKLKDFFGKAFSKVRKLGESRNFFDEKEKFILQCLNGISYQIDIKESKITSFKGNIENLTEYSTSEFLEGKKLWLDLIYEEDLKTFLSESKKLIINENYIADTEYRIITKNGKIKWIRDIAKNFTIKGKKIICGILYDITEQKEKDEYSTLVKKSIENARIPVFWIGDKGEILYVNKAACKALEYTKEELLKMTVFDIDPNIKKENWEKHWQKTLEKKSCVFETQHKSKSGRIFPVEIFVDTIEFKGKFIHWDFVNDITERKDYEKELIEAKRKAEISDNLKSAFLSQMSHEIRTPLQKILGFVSLIKDYIEEITGPLNKEIDDYFSLISLSSKRLLRTIDTILNMSEIQTNSYKPIFVDRDLYPLLKEIYEDFKQDAELKELDFIFLNFSRSTNVRVDEYSIIQIFENLLDNAIKYTKEGEVKIIINNDENNRLYVEVSDTGIGMSKEFISKLFKPFNQEEIGYTRRYDGLGLGLALVKKYCELNNALIDVKSEKNIGTTIRITFMSTPQTPNFSSDYLHSPELNKL
ncbi:MAG: PAS domain S-box protein [Melioribacter sp.]|nr:PAS domain S-box protein [Melioribacter sp.]